MENIIPSLKGTRDFYPEDMARRTWLYGKIKEVSELYGYQEYEGPFLERIDLYAAKSGEELVKEQAFVFPDRGGDLITLRPELTPTLARMVAQRQRQLTYPLRWWSFGPFWRYERPQKGRTREFFQWNIDLIGPNSPEGDAELVAICAAFFKQVGLTPQQVGLSVNDRRLMDSELTRLGMGTPELKKTVFKLIDRRDKLRSTEWEAFALESGLSRGQFADLVGILNDPDLWKRSEEMKRFFETLAIYGGDEYTRFNAQVIRGLDYYTGTVFEAHDMDREGRAILGGGHYDNLVADVGGDPLPGVGFAMGDVMITHVLEKYGCLPLFNPSPAAVLVTVFEEIELNASLRLAAQLRAEGLSVVCFTEPVKLPKQLKYADRMGIRCAIIVGPDEKGRWVGDRQKPGAR
jgi:histidyl-tRNA synthetase